MTKYIDRYYLNGELYGIKFAGWSRLPSEYQEVEYIQGTWTQYINTWIWCTLDTVVEMKINIQDATESVVMWTLWWYNANFLMCYQNNLRWHCNDYVDIPCSLDTDYTIKTENWQITVNWTSYTNTPTSFMYPYNLSIFASTYNLNMPRWQFKIYYFNMYNNNTLVRDLVPCYRIADSAIWMYDLVNDVFYTNAWTWTFTKWPNI